MPISNILGLVLTGEGQTVKMSLSLFLSDLGKTMEEMASLTPLSLLLLSLHLEATLLTKPWFSDLSLSSGSGCLFTEAGLLGAMYLVCKQGLQSRNWE